MTALIIFAACIFALLLLFAVFLFLISGRRRHPTGFRFRGLYAHRGLYSNKTPEAPENSMPAFHRAVEHGFGIELDVHLSADGELFVFHDENMKRMCGLDRNITEMTSDEIFSVRLLGGAESPPRFSDVLSLVSGRVPLIIELKCEPRVDPSPLCLAVSATLSRYRGEYCIESFNPYVVGWYKKHEPSVYRGQLAERFFTRGKHRKNGAALFMLENLLMNVVGRPDFVAYNCKHTDAPAYRAWRRLLRMPTALWTVRDADAYRLAAPDCDCVIFEGFLPRRDGRRT